LGYFCKLKKLCTHRKKSPNRLKFAQSGHPEFRAEKLAFFSQQIDLSLKRMVDRREPMRSLQPYSGLRGQYASMHALKLITRVHNDTNHTEKLKTQAR
jgi:hypothetical protein